jgi:hypothetical protein
MCGTMFEITQEDYGRRQTCATCRRPFDVWFSKDPVNGQIGATLHFIDEKSAADEANPAGHETTSYQVAVSASRTNLPEPVQGPELPDEAHFHCSCRTRLAISRTQCEQRTRCPVCGTRMLVFMLFNSNSNSHIIQVFRLTDISSGRTVVLSKI